MKYQYDYDIKDDLIEILIQENDFSGMDQLSFYLKIFFDESEQAKKHLIKFCIYRLTAYLSNQKLRNFDCDVSKGVIESFTKTYNWLEGSVCRNQKDRKGNNISIKYELAAKNMVFRGDTMTSMWTLLKEYIKLKTHTYAIEKNDMWELYFLRNIDNIKLSANAGMFLQLGHSIGNFLPVPPGFNVGRSNYGRWDFWDLTLYRIYQWYKANSSRSRQINNIALNKLFTDSSNKFQTIRNCQKWLESFATWENFVKSNYLQPYINDKGIPIRFFNNHSFSYPLPKTLEEFEICFETIHDCIKKRGCAISTVLKEKSE